MSIGRSAQAVACPHCLEGFASLGIGAARRQQLAPSWAAEAVPQKSGREVWAPDIIHLGDRYLLYFAKVSTWGKNTSAIGLATNPHALAPNDALYH